MAQSLSLQRRVTDFGADVSFSRASEKMKEHYGITVPVSSIQRITESHAENIKENEQLRTDIPDQRGVECLIAEMDGTMIPIVDTFDKTDEEGKAIDKRKTREVRWKEARLSLAHPKGSVSPHFGATLGDRMKQVINWPTVQFLQGLQTIVRYIVLVMGLCGFLSK